MSGCASCDAEVDWVIVAKSGKRMLIDRAPRDDGNIVQIGTNGMGDRLVALYVAPPATLFGPDEPRPARYVSHFVTCPKADEWRRR